MFAIPGILALLFFIYVRPLEFLPQLRSLPMLYLLLGLALFGWAVDLRLRRARPVTTPHLLWVVLFFLWCIITVAIRAPSTLTKNATELAISITFYLLIAHAVQSFRVFQLLVGLVLALAIFLAFIGVHQGLQPYGCLVLYPGQHDAAVGIPDGRPCDMNDRECYRGNAEPGLDFMCEQIGLFGTSSVGHGRVRYLGPLTDPNELALAIGVGLPFAFAFLERRRTVSRTVLLLVTIGLVGTCTVFTQSRGGQLVFLAVVGAYFIKRFGWRGALLGALLAAPLLALGGRSGREADASSLERLECWYTGMAMFKGAPFLGVGMGQFLEHHFLTAHNSYVLAAAELGYPGLFLWTMILYVSIKISVAALRRYAVGTAAGDVMGAEVARTWAMALLACQIGMLVGIFFLSFCYKQFLWIYIGLSGAFYTTVKTHDPAWEVTIGTRDIVLLAGIDAVLVVILYVYTHLKV